MYRDHTGFAELHRECLTDLLNCKGLCLCTCICCCFNGFPGEAKGRRIPAQVQKKA